MLAPPPFGIYRAGDIDQLGGEGGCFYQTDDGELERIRGTDKLYPENIYDSAGRLLLEIRPDERGFSLLNTLSRRPNTPVVAVLAIYDLTKRVILERTGYERVNRGEYCDGCMTLVKDEFLNRSSDRPSVDSAAIEILGPLHRELLEIIKGREFNLFTVSRTGRRILVDVYEDVRILEWRKLYEENKFRSELLG